MKPLVDAATAQEVAAEARQIVQDAIKDAEQATGVTHEEFRERMEDERQHRANVDLIRKARRKLLEDDDEWMSQPLTAEEQRMVDEADAGEGEEW